MREQVLPDPIHAAQHRPVDHPQQPASADDLPQPLGADPLPELVGADIGQRLVLAEHDLAVVELQRVGQPRLAEGDALGPTGERLEGTVDRRVAEGPDVGDGQAGLGQGVGHDRAVATQLLETGDEFVVGALAGGRDQLLAELIDRPHPLVALWAVTRLDDVDDAVDEAVEADHAVAGAEPLGGRPRGGCGGLGDLGACGHEARL
jgi:hypothetical protein